MFLSIDKYLSYIYMLYLYLYIKSNKTMYNNSQLTLTAGCLLVEPRTSSHKSWSLQTPTTTLENADAPPLKPRWPRQAAMAKRGE